MTLHEEEPTLTASRTSLFHVEEAGRKWLRRYIDETQPTLNNFAKVVRSLEERQLD